MNYFQVMPRRGTLRGMLRVNIKVYLIIFIFWILTIVILLIHTKQTLRTLIKENVCDENTESWSMRHKVNEMNDKDSYAMSPLDDFINYPCVEGLPLFPENRWPIEGKCVRTLVGGHNNINISLCVPLHTLKGTTPICTYPSTIDVYISAGLQRNGSWEGNMVNDLATIFMEHPELVFLDLGCNIGTYSLSLAHMGVNVTAIDALTDNLKLFHESVRLGNLQERIRIIWNAVSNDHSLVELNTPGYNVGGTYIQHTVKSVTNEMITKVVRTITLDDLVPLFKGKRVGMKIDIEAGEYAAILGGKKFFQEVHVLIIQMEWLYQARNVTAATKIVRFLSSVGLVAFNDIHMEKPLDIHNVSAWPFDVYFIKG